MCSMQAVIKTDYITMRQTGSDVWGYNRFYMDSCNVGLWSGGGWSAGLYGILNNA